MWQISLTIRYSDCQWKSTVQIKVKLEIQSIHVKKIKFQMKAVKLLESYYEQEPWSTTLPSSVPAFKVTCSKLTIETPEQCVKSIQS